MDVNVTLRLLFGVLIFAVTVVRGGQVVGVQSLSAREREYGIKDNFCRLLAQKSEFLPQGEG